MYGYPPMPLPMGPPMSALAARSALPMASAFPFAGGAAPAAMGGALSSGLGGSALASGGGALASISRFMPIIQGGAKWIPVIRRYGPMVRQIPGVVRQVNQMRRNSRQTPLSNTEQELMIEESQQFEPPLLEDRIESEHAQFVDSHEHVNETSDIDLSQTRANQWYTGDDPPPKLYI
ncbi:VrrA/YqfQ family protein [Geomicrobium sp. JCM 19055]|uniref:VrrA/YqfQ family protein n=1 Tax=Geomicrobium sp. JCM 19055 TaxID=1460649 RepID=UPI0005AA8ECB|nr:VrrA/YqfQ family protein [Geomicrobium sp. JCM 19055]